ncbi:hypothetical protein BJP34_35140 [Moorena producens PAL-8-15-08-1]|uniref:Capsule biosynthesis protein n=1 Tax=Moorena producens PAL-8-15-08-1 TaxID=1458985 RepID=A0A1D8U243_9CYAN|nr:hypothetical protein [Moorena producens]AOX03971.1 hypothetical protein BJP34_35140 [Moorena producens PAL-8-15-08-1]
MDLLLIESSSFSPALGTAGEIAINAAVAGKKTGFSFLYVDNPEDPRWMCNRQSQRFGKRSWKHKVSKVESLLRNYGVTTLPDEFLSEKTRLTIQDYVQNAPHSLRELKAYKYNDADLGLATVSSLISQTLSSHPDPDHHYPLIQRFLLCSAMVYEKARALLLKNKPQKIIAWNGRTASKKGIFEAAKQLGVEVQYSERGATKDRYELFDQPPHDLAYIREQIKTYWQQAGMDREELGHTFYKNKRQGEGIGSTRFTSEQQQGLVPEQTANHRQIVYYSSSDDEYAAVGDLVKHPIFKNQREAVKSLITWASNQMDCYLTIRIHPHLQKKSLEDRNWWNSLTGKNVQVIPPDSKVDSYALMDWADVVVTYGSTTGVEAAYWGKPSVLLGDSMYSELGCVYQPRSEAEVYPLLENDTLAPLPQETCLPYGYYSLRKGMTYNYYNPKTAFTGDFLGEPLD